MSHPGHEIVKCSQCQRVIRQCMCPSQDKPIRFEYCGCNRPSSPRKQVQATSLDDVRIEVLGEGRYQTIPAKLILWVVTPYDNRLSLAWMQRSCDFPVGVPYNIASYALLTHLLAEWAGMDAGSLDCIFCDAHIYLNQMDGVREQLSRVPSELPELAVRFRDENDFESWDCELFNWKPQPNIDFGTVEV